jgi:hypothetical protein
MRGTRSRPASCSRRRHERADGEREAATPPAAGPARDGIPAPTRRDVGEACRRIIDGPDRPRSPPGDLEREPERRLVERDEARRIVVGEQRLPEPAEHASDAGGVVRVWPALLGEPEQDERGSHERRHGGGERGART